MKLTSKEFDVLSFLMRHVEKVCTHQMILTAVWGTSYTRESQYLHVYTSRLRQKIGDASGIVLKTVPGVGYILSATDN
jgi:DNA-binding response OmpR family regulator